MRVKMQRVTGKKEPVQHYLSIPIHYIEPMNIGYRL
jgi:hypothetical protein